MFDVITYKDKQGNDLIREYLKELAEKSKRDKNARIRQKKILEYIDLLRNFGTRAGLPAMKHIEGELWELRPTNDRIFYAFYKDNTYILLHHYIKKSQKAPAREIEKAKNNLQEFLERSMN